MLFFYVSKYSTHFIHNSSLHIIMTKIYNVRLEWWSRHQSRSVHNNWSIKSVVNVVKRLGYEPIRMNEFLHCVEFSGTREEVIKQRTNITAAIKIVAREIPTKFHILEEEIV